MHEYNTGRKPLLLKEYGRNVQRLVNHISEIADKSQRTQYAHGILKLMNTLTANSKYQPIEYPQKRWDDLFIISDYSLEIDTDRVMPKKDALVQKPQQLTYSKAPLKYKHYGRHIEMLTKKATELTDPLAQEQVVISIAKLIKSLSSIWNKDNLDTNTLLATIQDMGGGKLQVDWEKIKSENSFYSTHSGGQKDKYKNYKKPKLVQTTRQHKS